MLLLVSIVVALSFAAGGAEQVPFYSCKIGGDTVAAVLIDQCSYADKSGSSHQRCILFQGNKIKVEAIFISPYGASDLEIVASAIIGKNTFPLPDSGFDPCQGSIIPACPIRKDRMYIFTTKFDLIQAFPTGPIDIQYGIRDRRTRKILGCALIPIHIKKSKRKEF